MKTSNNNSHQGPKNLLTSSIIKRSQEYTLFANNKWTHTTIRTFDYHKNICIQVNLYAHTFYNQHVFCLDLQVEIRAYILHGQAIPSLVLQADLRAHTLRN